MIRSQTQVSGKRWKPGCDFLTRAMVARNMTLTTGVSMTFPTKHLFLDTATQRSAYSVPHTMDHSVFLDVDDDHDKMGCRTTCQPRCYNIEASAGQGIHKYSL